MDHSRPAHPSDGLNKSSTCSTCGMGRDGAEIRKGFDVPTQAWAHSSSALCPLLGHSAQEGNHSLGKGPEKVTECQELLGLCEELL